jgi:uncharacterized membrane protein
METALWEWLAFGLRWLHAITAIAWIGSSFYFIALDLGLRKPADLPQGAGGEAWQVHGGGFYHIRKYMVAPARMPEELTWFKWESYATWLSGFFLLVVVYYAGAELYLIDRAVADLALWQAAAVGLAALAAGWVVYDLLCKSPVGRDDRVLGLAVFALILVEAWLLTLIFSGRGAFIHTGAIVATIMTANVFFIIIPNQKIVVADLIAGRMPDPRLGQQAKQRSLHNNYLTLPVVFLMLSGHHPLAFGSQWSVAVVALVIVAGASIRHYFNTMHATGRGPLWTWGLAALAFAAMIALSMKPAVEPARPAAARPGSQTAAFLASPHFPAARDVVQTRCVMCHQAEPVWTGIGVAPKGVRFDDDERIAAQAREIYLQSAHTRAMPPGNVTELPDSDRAILALWYRSTTR